tara:strand:- start:290 stop:697 length:408 start_codon:yes stop_codon:yes gene_type:complete
MKDIYENNNVLGLFFFISVLIFAITIGADHSGNLRSLTWFGDTSSFFIILSFAGFTYIKKDKFADHELGSVLKKDMILGGWMGLIIRFVMYMNMNDMKSFNFIIGFGVSIIPLLYGYVLGNIIESFWPYDRKSRS